VALVIVYPTVTAAMTNPDVLLPEQFSGRLEIPALAGIGSVAQHAYVALRQAILGMDAYDPDADLRLDEKRLAAELGVSRTPVREALSRLQHEGLVQIIPRRGVRVVRKSKAEIVETIIAWAALESMAARLACERAEDEQLATLDTLFASGRVLGGEPALPSAHHRARAFPVDRPHGRWPARARPRHPPPHNR